MSKYSVYVGNIGKVHSTNDFKNAEALFHEYVKQSQANYGRAAYETVTMVDSDGGTIKEFIGLNDLGDE